MPENSLITANHVSVYSGRLAVLKDVSLNIGQQDFITIIGPNGAGKSMLLKCLMGFYAPHQGNVIKRAGLKIGYVPQRLSVDQSIPITTRHFLMLRKKADAHTVQTITQETAISDILTKPLHALSSGELQRVLLARALLDEPNLLVLDEPAQNLDIGGQLRFYKLLEQIYKTRSISILMVSHDLHLVMRCSKQVLCLFHHVCCLGEPLAVTQDPAFISLFGNDMARLMTIYHHVHDHQHTP